MTISDEAKLAIDKVLLSGETAIDATMGQGWDTVYLAEKVGPEGTVFAFDVQKEALESTRKRLERAALLKRCQLHRLGHERLGEVVTTQVGAVMFNLGYLPYADRVITTTEATTLQAIQAAQQLLRPGGVMTIVCYRGHPGGQEEALAVWQWAAAQAKSMQVEGPKDYPAEAKPFLVVLTALASLDLPE